MQNPIRYREYKILLRADRCGEADGFEKFWHKIEAVADKCKIDITPSKTPFKHSQQDTFQAAEARCAVL